MEKINSTKEDIKLQICNVNKYYRLGNKNTFHALSDINVTFRKGELVSIIGESGSGKSTLMNLIGGLDSDFEGDIIADGQNLRLLKDKELDKYRKNKVGFVFQSFNLIPHLTILDNVTIALTLSNESPSVKQEKAEKLLTRLGLEKQMKKKPNQLSGGQKQRVAIARALINEPEIILADEPTGALDSGTTSQILEILKEIADEGKLVIMVTHSEKVASISSRIVEISDGRIVRDEVNKNYKKESKNLLLPNPSPNEQKTEEIESTHKKPTTKPFRSTKQNLSLISALRLSFHNMWASKTKNLLMAFGVSISILAMIIMLSFGSGLTDYINALASSYSNPLVVTISKVAQPDPNAPPGSSMMQDFAAPPAFEDGEISALASELNGKLESAGYDFRVIENGDDKNLSYGYTAAPGLGAVAGQNDVKAEWTYTYTDEDQTQKEIKDSIFFLYTTPEYYTNSNLLTSGENSHIAKPGEVMLSAAFAQKLNITEEECVGKEISIYVKFGKVEIEETVTVSAIANVQMFSNLMVMYVDYDYLDGLVYAATQDSENPIHLQPTSVYIKTDSEKTTKFINSYLKSQSNRFKGSVEEQLAGMFSEMMSTFSIALAVIAGISLLVAAIMILVVLYMSVTERTREIGVLKSIGARRKDIKRIFSSESFLIGLLSGIVGIIFSLAVSGILILVFNATLGLAPLSFRWWYFVGALGISILISVLSGLYPAAKAAKLDPVESLRHE